MKPVYVFWGICLFILTCFFFSYFNIPLLMPIMNIILLMFIPGFSILRILKITNINIAYRFPLVVASSVAFVMLWGFISDNFLYFVGYATPLSRIPLSAQMCVSILVILIIAFFNNKQTFSIRFPKISLKSIDIIFLALAILILAGCIFGSHTMALSDKSTVLLISLISAAVFGVSVPLFHKKLSNEMLPLYLWILSISCLVVLPLRTIHIAGADVHGTYFIFQQLSSILHWKIVVPTNVASGCLSVTTLPTVVNSLLGFDTENFYKFFFPVIFSISPLIVFNISKKYIKQPYAFISASFFIAQSYFFHSSSLPRIIMAIMFFAILVQVIYHLNLLRYQRTVLTLLFSIAAIVSHYGTSFILVAVFLLTYITMVVIHFFTKSKRFLGFPFIIFLSLFVYIWYALVTSEAFTSAVLFLNATVQKLGQFFIADSRGDVITTVLGSGIAEKIIPAKIEFGITWTTFILITRRAEFHGPSPWVNG